MWFWLVVAIAVGIYFLYRSSQSKSVERVDQQWDDSYEVQASPDPEPTFQSVVEANLSWLLERWTTANTERESEKPGSFPGWYFRAVTKAQRSFLEREGITIEGDINRGQASDIIGLRSAPDPEDEQFLKFFDVSTKGMNQTKAREESRRIRLDPDKMSRWDSRPPSSNQKKYIRHFGKKVPGTLTYTEAVQLIEEIDKDPENAMKVREWEIKEEIADIFDDPDAREEHEIKKPKKAQIEAVYEALYSDAEDLDDLVVDEYEVAEKLIDLFPELERG